MASQLISPQEYRRRLLDGMAKAVAARGYGNTTIGDVVREAAVSRRTFYEHFATKSDCLIALYKAAAGRVLKDVQAIVDARRDWQARMDQALTAYLGSLANNPVLLHTLFVEILALGPEGLQARRQVYLDLARFIGETVNDGQSSPGAAALTPDMAMAIVGGVNELILSAVENNQADDLSRLKEPSLRLIRSVAGGAGAIAALTGPT